VQAVAVVRERQGNQPIPRPPASNSTEHERALEISGSRPSCQRHRLIPVGAPQSFEPPTRVKCACARVAGNNIRPTRIGQRIDPNRAFQDSPPAVSGHTNARDPQAGRRLQDRHRQTGSTDRRRHGDNEIGLQTRYLEGLPICVPVAARMPHCDVLVRFVRKVALPGTVVTRRRPLYLR